MDILEWITSKTGMIVIGVVIVLIILAVLFGLGYIPVPTLS